MKKYINRNFFWADLFVSQLSKLGVRHVCISPGSRNTPLTLAFAQNKSFKKYIHVDERSSGFFALGIAKKSKQPVAIVTTSGTAVAELYPAIIEAFIQRVPLIICTADRPAYLINTGANQTINQKNIFSNHIRCFVDFGLPTLNLPKLKLFCKNVVNSIEIGVVSNPGPIHFNFPFKKPLEPNSFTDNIDIRIKEYLLSKPKTKAITLKRSEVSKFISSLDKSKRPLLHIGWSEFPSQFYKKLIKFSSKNNIPILVDGTSDLRFCKGNNQTIITNHSAFLPYIETEPDLIINFGNAPTSNSVLNYFENTSAKRILVNKFGDLKDPAITKGELFKCDPIVILDQLIRYNFNASKLNKWNGYIIEKDTICEVQKKLIHSSSFGNESRIVNEVLSIIPENSNLFVSNSLPIRDFDYFASKRKSNLNIYTNRGASGIDGIISTASGIASQTNNATFLIIGDLAFYHNINALATLKEMSIPLKIILVNNNGGGIFNMLPVADSSKNFSKYFTTSQNLDFGNIVKAFNGNYYLAKTWNSLRKNLMKVIEKNSYSVIEILTDANNSVNMRKKYWKIVGEQLKLSNVSKNK